MKNIVEILKVLSNESRLQILLWLKNPKKYFSHCTDVDMIEIGVCVGEIQRLLGFTQSTTSQYLSILQKSDLVIATRIGKWTYYKRNEETIKKLGEFIGKEL